MVQEAKITRVRGGNRHPISSKDFIITWLAMAREDSASSIHQAYKRALRQLAIEKGRRYAYHSPRAHSFKGVIHRLINEGIVEFSGREELSDSPRFVNWKEIPMRRYYRLVHPPAELPVLPVSLDGRGVNGIPPTTLSLDGAGTDGHPKTTPSTNGKGV